MSTRDKIVTAAVDLFIKQGIAGTTTREIAASASVAEGSIYRYFPSKDELAWQVFDEYHQTLAQKLLQSVINEQQLMDKIAALVHCFLSMADEDWLMFRYYLTSQHTHMQKVDSTTLTPYKVVLQVVQELIKSEVIKSNDVNLLCAMVMGAVHQIGINKIYGRIQGDLLPHKQLVTQTIFQMLNANECEK